MNIFIIGLPKSGKTTVAEALCKSSKFEYIDSASWLRATFRHKKDDEHEQQYEEAFHQFLVNRLKIDPKLSIKNIQSTMASYTHSFEFVIDGVIGPRDFAELFNYNQDIVVFLNRVNNDAECRDYHNISVSVIRDYCFWMASVGLLDKKRWLEYNFKIPGEESNDVKVLGSKNSVYLVKSLNKVISHLKDKIFSLQDPQS